MARRAVTTVVIEGPAGAERLDAVVHGIRKREIVRPWRRRIGDNRAVWSGDSRGCPHPSNRQRRAHRADDNTSASVAGVSAQLTLQAAPVASGSLKPTSTVSVQAIENRLRVVAHVSEQIDHYLLTDAVNLERFVTAELVFGLRKSLETQIISGDALSSGWLRRPPTTTATRSPGSQGCL